MARMEPAVRRETLYILYAECIGSLLMQAVFLILRRWDYTVLLGNLLSGVAAVGNFALMGLTVQKAVGREEKEAAQLLKTSQALRLFLLFAIAALGAFLPCFHTAAVLIPLFFPRVALIFRPYIGKKEASDEK